MSNFMSKEDKRMPVREGKRENEIDKEKIMKTARVRKKQKRKKKEVSASKRNKEERN